jgi:hypothetical protein
LSRQVGDGVLQDQSSSQTAFVMPSAEEEYCNLATVGDAVHDSFPLENSHQSDELKALVFEGERDDLCEDENLKKKFIKDFKFNDFIRQQSLKSLPLKPTTIISSSFIKKRDKENEPKMIVPLHSGHSLKPISIKKKNPLVEPKDLPIHLQASPYLHSTKRNSDIDYSRAEHAIGESTDESIPLVAPKKAIGQSISPR